MALCQTGGRPGLGGIVQPVPEAIEVGNRMNFLMELRLDEGELGEAEARRRLEEWWKSRSSSS